MWIYRISITGIGCKRRASLAFESDLEQADGTTFKYTLENAGVYKYVSIPHETLGMKGVVVSYLSRICFPYFLRCAQTSGCSEARSIDTGGLVGSVRLDVAEVMPRRFTDAIS